MKILITHVYSRDNNGDAAILSCLLRELRRVFDDPQFIISTMEQSALNETFEGVSHIPSLINSAIDSRLTPIRKLFSILRSWFITSLWAIIFNVSNKRFNPILISDELLFMNHLADADLVVAVGGGYIQSKAGFKKTLDLLLVLHPLRLSHAMGKKTILHTQSIKPFGSKYQEWLANAVIKTMDLIIIRESITKSLLKRNNIADEKIEMSADAAFLLIKERIAGVLPKELHDIRNKCIGPIIGVTARSFLEKNEQEKYEHEISLALDALITVHNACVVFIPQVTVARCGDDDRLVQTRIFNNMKQKKKAINMVGVYNFSNIRAMYSTLDVLIGTRFHSVIFSLISGVPAIAIEYEHKTRGIMNDLGLGEWVIPMEEVAQPKIIELFERLHSRKEAYLETLRATMPNYVKSAERAAEKIYELFQGRIQN